ncbi:SOS response-associated peptidase [Chitinimonas sp.]|uniref:SOS response-associated peptidase n=1 Tax=Chitinimonas sp. TaxID=1934313 RepID=UPI002F926E8D
MCGRYNVIDSPEVRALCDILGITTYPPTRLNISPGGQGEFIAEIDGARQLTTGYWSALIEPKATGGYRPNPKFKTFNARSDRLTSSPLWKKLYSSKRAIIPATGWHEWMEGPDGKKQCFQLEFGDQAIAFGGLYQLYQFGEELVPAYSIITLPPHERVAHIHEKSLPLILQPKDFDMWLDPTFKQTDAFADLMQPVLRHVLRAIPVNSPKDMLAVGPVELIPPD